MWWLGFRQVRVKTKQGVIESPGRAVVCGPYESLAAAGRERLRRLEREWDAAYSQPFEAEDKEAAEQLVESLTPKA